MSWQTAQPARLVVVGDSLAFHGPSGPVGLADPRLYPNRLGARLEQATAEPWNVQVVARAGWSIRDVRLALQNDGAAGEVINLAESRTYPMGLWVELIVQAAGSDAELVRVPDDALPPDLAITGAPGQHLLVTGRYQSGGEDIAGTGRRDLTRDECLDPVAQRYLPGQLVIQPGARLGAHAREDVADQSGVHHRDHRRLREVDAERLRDDAGQRRIAGLAPEICDQDPFPVVEHAGRAGIPTAMAR
jgi:hypothetical protein